MCKCILDATNVKGHHETTFKGENYDLVGLL